MGPHFFSFPSQLASNPFFCLPTKPPATGVVGIGDLELPAPPRTQFLAINPLEDPSLYTVTVQGYTIDGLRLYGDDGFGDLFGTMLSSYLTLDTAVAVSYLPPEILSVVRDAFATAAHARGLSEEPVTEGLRPCFRLGPDGPNEGNTPSLTMHFRGARARGDASITLPPDNVWYPSATTPGVSCLAFDNSPYEHMAILGSVQLSSSLVYIDKQRSTMRITPGYC